MKENYKYIWLTVCLLVLAACQSQAENPDTPSPAETAVLPATEAPAQTATEPPAVANIFGEGTFSLDIPEGWDVFGPEIVNADPNRPYKLYLLGENPSAGSGPGTSRVVIGDATQWSPEEFALAQCSTCPVNPFESVTIGGKQALRTEVGGGGVPIMITWYFAENQGNFIAFALHDPETLEPLEDVIASIQFE